MSRGMCGVGGGWHGCTLLCIVLPVVVFGCGAVVFSCVL